MRGAALTPVSARAAPFVGAVLLLVSLSAALGGCQGGVGASPRAREAAMRGDGDPGPDAAEPEDLGDAPLGVGPIEFPNPGRGGEDESDAREDRSVAGDEGWDEKWALASRYAAGGFDEAATEVVDAALAAGPPEPWATRLKGLRASIRVRQAESVLRVDVRGSRDYVDFGEDVEWVVRFRNVSDEEIVFAPPGTAVAPDGSPLSATVLSLEILRRDLDIYSSELSRTWTQTVWLQRPGAAEVRIPPGGRHEVRAKVPAADAGAPISGLRIFEVGGVLRPSGLSVGGRTVAEPLRIRPGRAIALPHGYEPLAADPLSSMARAVDALAPVHLLVAGEFVPREEGARAAEILARALGEGDPALRTAAVGSLGRLRERCVGMPLAPLAAPLIGSLAAHPERSADVIDGLEALTDRRTAPDSRLWMEWWRREQASGAVVTAPPGRESP